MARYIIWYEKEGYCLHILLSNGSYTVTIPVLAPLLYCKLRLDLFWNGISHFSFTLHVYKNEYSIMITGLYLLIFTIISNTREAVCTYLLTYFDF